MSQTSACQKLLYDALSNNSALVAALGGVFIYDDVPRQKKMPYITFGKITSNEWDTSTEYGLEHFVELVIWEKSNGRKKCLALAELASAALADLAASFENQTLVNAHLQKTQSQYDKSNKCFTAILTIRMVTEPQS